jgi:hypothetical protein
LNNSTSENEWLHYYRNSLVDADRASIRPDENSVIVVALEELTEQQAKKLLPVMTTAEGKKETAFEGPVQIAPFGLAETVDHGYKAGGGPLYPFWIPAIITRSGELLPPEDDRHMPWFLREVMSPASEQSSYPAVGSVENYSKALEQFHWTGTDWPSFFEVSERIFSSVTGQRLAEFELEGYTRIAEFALVKAEVSFLTAPLIECYDSFLKGDVELGRLGRTYLSAFANSPLREVPPPANVYLDHRHVGQMNDSFPLSDSQRYAMTLHLRTQESELLAVNGPPGTGKTTFLRSVVANLIVEKALEGKSPPMLLASSTNNQAITNILENFASSEENANPLASSWVRLGGAVGAYMASDAKAGDYQGEAPIITSSRGSFDGTYLSAMGGVVSSEESRGFLSKLTEVFGNDAGAVKSVEDASAFLNKKVTAEARFISECVAGATELGEQLSGGEDPFEAAENYLSRLRNEESECARRIDKANRLSEAYLAADRETGGKVSAALSGRARVKRFNDLRLRLEPFAPEGFFEPYERADELSSAIAKYIDQCRIDARVASAATGRAEELIAPLRKLKKRVEDYLASGALGAPALRERLRENEWYMGLGDALDVTARYSAFLLAQRYWEARWLIAIKDRPDEFSKGKKGKTGFFAEVGHLTPMFVCTCHSVPKFLSFFARGSSSTWRKVPLADFFDLVIMDEAGQVTPEIGLVPFLFGKRGLVVGDVYQIEPIWAIASDRVDMANLAQFQLFKDVDDYDRLKEAGILASGGSAMAVAQRCSRYRYPEDMPVRGTLLREHRRCVDEIITYCDSYVYDNKLLPKTGTLFEHKRKRTDNHKPINSLPALGYVNIRGNARRPASGSRVNLVEAQAIASFIASRQEEIVASYDGKRIADLVGIVTPFRAQAYAIKDEIAKAGIDPDGDMVVGTVHSLQGAERPIVLFSPTYDLKDAEGKMFIDDGWNMMNVAVSRAKHHFIVIGEMGRFNPQRSNLPSGALARLLFSDPENEISPAFFFETTTRFDSMTQDEPTAVVRLDTLVKHVRALARAFEKAINRIVIVSPFISYDAITKDELAIKIEGAAKRGVDILVYTDGYLDTTHGGLKEHSKRGRATLKKSGANLIVKNGIHNKALAIDDDVLIEGSFNWLSAARDANSKYHRHEVSVVVQTEQTKQFIQDLLASLEATPALED